MRKRLAFGAVLAALVPSFNRLLGLSGMEFAGSGRTGLKPRSRIIAEQDLAEHRAKFAHLALVPDDTRQLRRQRARLAAKGRMI